MPQCTPTHHNNKGKKENKIFKKVKIYKAYSLITMKLNYESLIGRNLEKFTNM
jgi:hypothetical protein